MITTDTADTRFTQLTFHKLLVLEGLVNNLEFTDDEIARWAEAQGLGCVRKDTGDLCVAALRVRSYAEAHGQTLDKIKAYKGKGKAWVKKIEDRYSGWKIGSYSGQDIMVGHDEDIQDDSQQ